MAVSWPVPSEISAASTEFRSTGRISTTRTRPSTVARPGLVSAPMGVIPGSAVNSPWSEAAASAERWPFFGGHPGCGPAAAPCWAATSASPDLTC